MLAIVRRTGFPLVQETAVMKIGFIGNNSLADFFDAKQCCGFRANFGCAV